MSLVPLRILLDHAAENDYGLAAFRVSNMEQIQAVMEAATELNAPVILQASRGSLAYAQGAYWRYLVLAAVESNPTIPVAMHLDHANSLEACLDAIGHKFTSVHIDGTLRLEEGRLVPASSEDNVQVTREVVQAAHPQGVTVEGELGCLFGIEDGHGFGLSDDECFSTRCDESLVERFVAETGVDALGVDTLTYTRGAGAYKFRSSRHWGSLNTDGFEQIHRCLPNTHLVLHRAPSWPQELLDEIRTYGGYVKDVEGVTIADIQQAIHHGIRKITVDLDCHLAMTGAIRKALACRPIEIDPRAYLKLARDAMKDVCIARMEAFGQAGQAGKIKQRSCQEVIES